MEYFNDDISEDSSVSSEKSVCLSSTDVTVERTAR